MSERSTLTILAEEVASALTPLADAIGSPQNFNAFMLELGWDLAAIPQPLHNLSAPLQDIIDIIESGTVDSSNVDNLISAIDVFIAAVKQTKDQPDDLFPASVDVAQFKNEVPLQLLQVLLVEYLLNNHPFWGNLLKTLGLIQIELVAASGSRPAYRKKEILWDQLGDVLNDPFAFLRDIYKWGTPVFDGNSLIQNILDLVQSRGIEVRLDRLEDKLFAFLTDGALDLDHVHQFVVRTPIVEDRSQAETTEMGIGLFVLPETAEAKPGFAILPYGKGDVYQQLDLTDAVVLNVEGGIDLVAGVGILVQPDRGIQVLVQIIPSVEAGVQPPSSGFLAISLQTRAGATEKRILLGSEGTSRFEVGALSLEVGARTLASRKADAYTEFELQDASIVIDPGGDADSFLRSLLPEDGFAFDFSLILGFSSSQGFYFGGSGGLEVNLPAHLRAGPVEVISSTLAVKARDGAVPVEVGASVRGALGPVQVVTENFGLRTTFAFRTDYDGNLGAVDLSLGFKPPSGIGLSIDAGAVTGGGFLYFDPEEEQYAGAVHLEIEGGMSLNAIGLLTTRLPDGSKGFSLLVIVTASGFAPIQLGFGFTLNGVGGLLGINRAVAVDVLRAGVRSRALEPILFSREDPIPRAPAIISALRSVFPPARDRYVFGPMAMIGWGTPTVLTIEVAVLLELLAPLRLIVLGRLRALLPGPTEQTALVKLNMDVLGVVDFDRREVSIDATLYDSYVAAFAISGDMALRASWGERPGFTLAVGGFHPRFQPPPEFPALRRLAISLSTSDNPRLRLEAYLAITSNTVQLGACLDLYVEALGFNLIGMLSFDALVQFAPFGLDLEVAGMLALRRGTSTLMGLELRMRLTGPAPWHARGEASFKILFIKITIGFDARFGEERLQRAPEPVEIWPLLKDALSDARNWGAELPGEGSALATVRAVDPPSGEVLVHPSGEVSVRQRVLPLDRNVSRFANAPPADYRRFRIASISAGGEILASQTTYEHFAPAQFEDMPDDRKLASPGFDPMPAGARAPGVAVKAGPDQAVTLGYETIVVEPPGASPAQPLPGLYTPPADTLALLAETGAAATAEIRRRGRAKFAADGDAAVALSDPEFTVVTREGLAPPEDLLPTDGSFTGAREELRRLIAESPRYRGNVQVVRREEALV